MTDNFQGDNAKLIECIGASSILTWAVERWHAEVAQRSLVNVHRRSLDDCWRQVVRRCGEDDVVLLGPRHDDLVAAMRQAGAAAPTAAGEGEG